jgi:hypothetical protein
MSTNETEKKDDDEENQQSSTKSETHLADKTIPQGNTSAERNLQKSVSTRQTT